MAKTQEQFLFSWKDVENLGDLKRLELVLENIPDDELIAKLREERGKGRNDYPIHAIWNSIIAGVVFQHNSIESLRRELLRNDRLRYICGFNPIIPAEVVVPKSYNYTRFLKKLLKHEDEIEKMFNTLVSKIKELLPDFGKILAYDGKALPSLSKHKPKDEKGKEDGRRDEDADYGVKKYCGVDENGKLWEKVKSWFGYKLHLIIDANYELPICFEVTKASVSETPTAHKLLENINKNHKDIIDDAEYFLSDRGNDDTKLITELWEKYEIKPIIDIRNMWKDGEKTRGLSSGENVVYDYKGQVSCVCPKSGELKEMAYGGYEKDRNCLRFLCPAVHYGVSCKGQSECKIKRYVRIKLKEDPRIFTPVPK